MEEYVANLDKIKMCSVLVEAGVIKSMPMVLSCIIDPFEFQKKEIEDYMKKAKCKYEFYYKEDNVVKFTLFLYNDPFHKEIYEAAKKKDDKIYKYAYYRMIGYEDSKACELVNCQ